MGAYRVILAGPATSTLATILHNASLNLTYAWTRVTREATLLKRITFRADGDLIKAARRRAAAQGTTLDLQFRLWLADYAGQGHQAAKAVAVMRELRGKLRVGRKFTRDEMNER